MPEIPTLTEILGTHSLRYEGSILGFGCNCGILLAASDAPEADRDRAYAEHVAERYREARTIRDLAQVYDLPIGSVIREHPENPLVGWVAKRYRPDQGSWREPGAATPLVIEAEDLPVLVLHTPRDEAKP